MGKAKQLKKLRRVASQLPNIITRHPVAQEISGYNLLQKGFKDINGVAISANETYNVIVPEKAPLNHNRQMKKMYNKFGFAGAVGYANAVVRFYSQNKPKPSEEKKAPE